MLKKSIYIGVIIVMVLFACVGCGVKYNAVISDNATEYVNAEFIESNRTLGAYYGEDNIADDSNPKFRTFIIKSQEDFDIIFAESMVYDVNFDSQMVIVYTFTAEYIRPVKIKNVNKNNDILKIVLDMNKGSGGTGDAVKPFQRFVLIKLDKIDITTIEIVEKNF